MRKCACQPVVFWYVVHARACPPVRMHLIHAYSVRLAVIKHSHPCLCLHATYISVQKYNPNVRSYALSGSKVQSVSI
jgi:hypothetical protein